MQLLPVGFGAWVPLKAVIAVLPYGSSPVKELVHNLKAQDKVLDVTYGRKTRAVIRMANGDVVLSSIVAETLAARVAQDGRRFGNERA